jgi:hypothetical protein
MGLVYLEALAGLELGLEVALDFAVKQQRPVVAVADVPAASE